MKGEGSIGKGSDEDRAFLSVAPSSWYQTRGMSEHNSHLLRNVSVNTVKDLNLTCSEPCIFPGEDI